jgi:predicted nuclease of predicted toxin-antitoxin system
VRFLVDENLSAGLCALLGQAGHDAVHVSERALRSASDADVLQAAADDDRVLISADADFSALLAHERRRSPSLVFFRQQDGRRVEALAQLLLDNLASFAADLEDGAVVVMTDDRIRIRALPILPPPEGA